MSDPSEFAWRPREIRRFIKSLPTGAGTVIVLTDAGEGYLKAMGNPGGEHCLACELVATELARWFGLPTFDYALVEVTELDEFPFAKGGKARPGPAFITRSEMGETWSGKKLQLDRLVNPGAISRLVVFDTWVLNCDRHAPNRERRPNYNNVFLSGEAPPGRLLLKAMDHTHAFDCGRDLSRRIAYIDRVRDRRVFGLFPAFRELVDQDDFQAAISELAHVSRPIVEGIVRSIPAEWDVSPEVREALTHLIVERARYLATDCTSIMGMGLNQSLLDLPIDGEDQP